LSVSPPVFQQLLYQSLFAGAAKSPNRICGDRYDPRRGAFDDPFQCCLRADVELLSDLRWHGDLPALRHFCTHSSEYTLPTINTRRILNYKTSVKVSCIRGMSYPGSDQRKVLIQRLPNGGSRGLRWFKGLTAVQSSRFKVQGIGSIRAVRLQRELGSLSTETLNKSSKLCVLL
jgi:hypothetical protein